MSRQSYQHSQSKHGADNSTFVNSNTMNLHNTVNSLNKRPFPAFLLKLYKLLEDNNNSDIVSWSLDGNSFIIKDIHKFSSQILPKYFKHKNFPSFHRQLHMYNFKKRRELDYDHTWYHDLFSKGGINNLHLIKRQKKNDKNKKASADAISLLFDKAPNEKNLTKKNFKNIINILLNKISDLKTKQDNLENISNLVAEQNKELLCHNEILIKELKNKIDYNKKLDTFILFIFEVICQKNNINIVNNGQLLPANDIDSNLNTNSTNNTSNSLMNGNCAKVITEELINYLKNNINCENTNIQESYIKSLVDGYLNQLSKPKYENVNTFKEIKEEMLPNNKQILMLQANNDMMKSPNMSFIDNNDVRSVRSDYSFSNLNNGLSNNIYSKNGFDAEKRNGQSNIFNSHEQNGSYYDIASLNDDIFSNKGAWQNNGHNLAHTPKSVKSSIDINDLFFKNNSTEFNLNGSFIENSNHAQPISTIINENTDNIEISQHSDTQTGKN